MAVASESRYMQSSIPLGESLGMGLGMAGKQGMCISGTPESPMPALKALHGQTMEKIAGCPDGDAAHHTMKNKGRKIRSIPRLSAD